MEESNLVEIYAEVTPNPNTLKFVLNRQFLESGSCDFVSAESAADSPLPAAIFKIPEVKAVLVGKDFVTVTKGGDSQWEPLVNSVVDALRDFFKSGAAPLSPNATASPAQVSSDEIEQKIRQILDEEIRPAVARDGGDIIFYGFQDGVVTLHLQGACSSCPSSIMTLKMGVENRLKQAIPEIKSVISV